MDKVKFKIVSLDQLPFKFNKSKITNWKSEVFEISGEIETLKISSKSDVKNHGYSDKIVGESLPQSFNADILIAITNVPLELNWYSRRLSNNCVCLSYFQLADVLRPNNIPLENLVLRLLYSLTLVYKRYGGKLPESGEPTNFTHSDTRKCIFDFNGIKSDVIYSTVKPIVCDECSVQLQNEKVSKESIEVIKRELSGVKKDVYFTITDFIKGKPLLSLVVSAVVAIALGIVGSIIYDKWIKPFTSIDTQTNATEIKAPPRLH